MNNQQYSGKRLTISEYYQIIKHKRYRSSFRGNKLSTMGIYVR